MHITFVLQNTFLSFIVSDSQMTNFIIIISGGFVIGIIFLVFASYIAKRRRRNKERRKGLLREKYFSADDNDGADTPLRGNGYKKDARTGK